MSKIVKRCTTVLVATSMIFSLSGCGQSEKLNPDTNVNGSSSSVNGPSETVSEGSDTSFLYSSATQSLISSTQEQPVKSSSSKKNSSKKTSPPRSGSKQDDTSTPPRDEENPIEELKISLLEAIKTRNTKTLTVVEKQVADKMIQIIDKVINSKMSDFEKALAIHDYMCINYEYDYENYYNGTVPSRSRSIVGLVLDGVGVCHAYTETFQLFMEAIDIPSEFVVGDTTSGKHTWNIIKIGSNWYHVDVTWDDTPLLYDYFLISDTKMGEDHSWIASKYPACAKTYPIDRTTYIVAEGTEKIDDCQFVNYKFINFTLPAGLKEIGTAAFKDCFKMQKITIPDSVQKIGGSAFEFCPALTQITIPDSVTYLGGYAFYNCGSLKTVTLGKGLKKIDVSTFAICRSLEEIIIPSSVTEIHEDAFKMCRTTFLTIFCKKGSYAESYAKKNKIAVKYY